MHSVNSDPKSLNSQTILQNCSILPFILPSPLPYYNVRLFVSCIIPNIKCWINCLFLFLLRWTALPPIRAESLLIALTNGWPGSTEPGWSVQRKVETKKREVKKWHEVEKKKKVEVKESIGTDEEKCSECLVKFSVQPRRLHYSCLTNLICRSAITLSAHRGGWLMSPHKSLMNSPKNNIKRTQDRFPHRERVGWSPYIIQYIVEYGI